MKRVIYYYTLYIIGLVYTMQCFGQSSPHNYNYISTCTVLEEGYTNIDNVWQDVTTFDVYQETMYYDELGRPSQLMKRTASHIGLKDIIQPFKYNEVGLEVKQYLPYVNSGNGNYDTNWEEAQINFYSGTNGVASDSEPYSYVHYDHSPLKRVLKRFGPGSAWHETDATNGTQYGHPVSYLYSTNYPNEVRKWKISTNDPYSVDAEDYTVSVNGYYDYGSLNRLEITDEDGNISVEFKDFKGNLILKKVSDGTRWLETYYLYNDKDLLQMVIPPKAYNVLIHRELVAMNDGQFITENTVISNPGSTTNYIVDNEAVLSFVPNFSYDAEQSGTLIASIEVIPTTDRVESELCYLYFYDRNNNLIAKNIPGNEVIRYCYTYNNLLTIVQDGNMRNNPDDGTDDEWLITKYDQLNRPVVVAKPVIDYERVLGGSMHYIARGGKSKYVVFDETASSSSYYRIDKGIGFDVIDNSNILSVNYYDQYFTDDINSNMMQEIPIDTYFPSIFHGFNNNYSEHTHGLLTRTKVKNLETGEFYNTLYYYDDRARILKTVSENQLGGITIVKFKYDFTGNLLATVIKQTGGERDHTHGFRYTYDKMGRLLNTYHGIGQPDNQSVKLIMVNEYNELGQLMTKYYYNSSASLLQEVNYTYNIRGWLESINNPDDMQNGELFAMKLYYNDYGDLGSLCNYFGPFNGNISAVEWKNPDNSHNTYGKAYGYNYDGMNRLTDAYYSAGGDSYLRLNSYSVRDIGYDMNGNITKLKRFGTSNYFSEPMDDLTYKYLNNSNRLANVNDAGNSTGFKDVTGIIDYSYDSNANITEDRNKGIEEITYNHLNLPNTIKMSGERTIDYHYDATGNKLTNIYTSESDIKTTDYINNFVYVDGELEYILHPEGRILVDGNNYTYEYHLKDHLGNTRVAFTDNGGTPQVTQINDYYPFGMRHEPVALGDATQKYLYNGKELQEGTGWYDYGRRMYDPALGRFHVQDRFAEKYLDISPYQYGANNPIAFIDVNGDSLVMFKNGTYVGTFDNGKEGYTGYNQESTVDKDGNETFTGGSSFEFNDAENDMAGIRNGEITTLNTDHFGSKFENAMEKSGVNDNHGLGLGYAWREGSGKMDYRYREGLDKSSLYLADGYAYNDFDYGNFMWGQGMKRLGIDYGTASFGAHVNNFLFGRGQQTSDMNKGAGTYQGWSPLDHPSDQSAIKRGYFYGPTKPQYLPIKTQTDNNYEIYGP